jgi:uncharacterized membrane protein
VTGASVLGIASVLVAPVFLVVAEKPVSMDLLVVLAAGLPLEIVGFYFFLAAIRMAPLSLTLPLLAFTPVFSIVTAAMILVEGISIQGGMGISLVTAGAYLLNANLVNHSVTAPIKAIFSNRGSRLMFLVALIWSVAATIGKRGVMVYGAIPFAFVILCAIAVVFCLVSFYRISKGYAVLDFSRQTATFLLPAGIMMAGAVVTHMIALSMAPVAYMIAVKRFSLVFGVILGWLFFGEENIRYRLLGACVMVSGAFFLNG